MKRQPLLSDPQKKTPPKKKPSPSSEMPNLEKDYNQVQFQQINHHDHSITGLVFLYLSQYVFASQTGSKTQKVLN